MPGSVYNPEQTQITDSTNVAGDLYGRSGEKIVAELHGKRYTASYRGYVYGFAVNAITLPVNAATLASKFTIANPASSNKNLELVSLSWAYALATTVVTGIGVYTNTLTGATLTTPGTAINLNTGNPVQAQGLPYSALTVVGTPTQVALVGYTGAVTSTAANVNEYDFDGTIVVTPGNLVTIAMTVAASTGSGFSGYLTWQENPL